MEVSDVAPALRERLGAGASAGLLALFTVARQEWTAEMTSAAVGRFEHRLSEEIGGLRAEFREDLRREIGGLRKEFRAELGTGIGSVREELREIRRDVMKVYQEQVSSWFTVVKWCFVFWVGQAIAVTGLIGVMLRFIRP